jgi:GNAT superfamily N-acetyltransferase
VTRSLTGPSSRSDRTSVDGRGTQPPLHVSEAGEAELSELDRVFGRFYGELYRERWQRPGAVLIARSDGDLVGVMWVSIDKPAEHEIIDWLGAVPMLHRLLVHPRARRRRIGTRLVQVAEERLRAQGYGHVAIGIDLDNVEAVKFWASVGYQEWSHGLLKTERQLDIGGEVVTEADQCRVFVKRLRAI